MVTRLAAFSIIVPLPACSSYLEGAATPPDTIVATPNTSTSMNPAPSVAPMVAGGASVTIRPPETAPTPPSEGQGSRPLVPPGSSTTPASTDAALVNEVCSALGSEDACGSCVCDACARELEKCAGTPGCAEILTCVRESACSGNACYCGTARLTDCAAGGGNGPCKAAVLAAPGGKEPTLLNPSGGPASDAAIAIANCADEDVSCAEVCDVGG